MTHRYTRIRDDADIWMPGRGGYWSIRPAQHATSARVYEPDTIMPVGRQLDAGAHDYVSLSAPDGVLRRIEVISGQVDVECGTARRKASIKTMPGIE